MNRKKHEAGNGNSSTTQLFDCMNSNKRVPPMWRVESTCVACTRKILVDQEPAFLWPRTGNADNFDWGFWGNDGIGGRNWSCYRSASSCRSLSDCIVSGGLRGYLLHSTVVCTKDCKITTCTRKWPSSLSLQILPIGFENEAFDWTVQEKEG